MYGYSLNIHGMLLSDKCVVTKWSVCLLRRSWQERLQRSEEQKQEEARLLEVSQVTSRVASFTVLLLCSDYSGITYLRIYLIIVVNQLVIAHIEYYMLQLVPVH